MNYYDMNNVDSSFYPGLNIVEETQNPANTFLQNISITSFFTLIPLKTHLQTEPAYLHLMGNDVTSHHTTLL